MATVRIKLESQSAAGKVGLVGRYSKQSMFGFMECIIYKLKMLNRFRTAENYITTLNGFRKFMNGEELLLEDICPDLMMRYEAYLFGRGVSKNTVSFYMRILRAVYNRAVEYGLTEQRYPFRHVYTGIDKTVKRAVSFEAVRRMKNLDLSSYPDLDFARDMFMFSFYTRGMSFIDMSHLRKTDLKNGVFVYRRSKTGQQISVRWEYCMQEIVSKYENKHTGHQSSSSSPYMLPILEYPSQEHCCRYRNRLQQINTALKTVAAMAGISIPLTMYVARHSWASIARAKNIPVSVISEGLGHDSETTTRIYLASLDNGIIDQANSLIISSL